MLSLRSPALALLRGLLKLEELPLDMPLAVDLSGVRLSAWSTPRERGNADELLARRRAALNRLSQLFLLAMGLWFLWTGLAG